MARPRLSPSGQRATLNVSLPPELLEAVRELAATEDRPLGSMVRVLLREAMERRGLSINLTLDLDDDPRPLA